jgi:hypothetical protein
MWANRPCVDSFARDQKKATAGPVFCNLISFAYAAQRVFSASVQAARDGAQKFQSLRALPVGDVGVFASRAPMSVKVQVPANTRIP